MKESTGERTLILFESRSTDAAFYFAAEEYIMKELKPGEPVLMLWSTGDTVMIGANQIVKAEIDEVYARDAGIDVVRRSSGGGTIFTDGGTLQYTVILKYDEERMDFDSKACMKEWLAEPLIETLGRFSVRAELSGRNDVTIEGKKISGLAQHVRYGFICSHGSLLYSTDLDKLVRVLTVDKEKIISKAIASVSARVAKIADYLPGNCRGMAGSCGRLIEGQVPGNENDEAGSCEGLTEGQVPKNDIDMAGSCEELIKDQVSGNDNGIDNDMKAFREALIESYRQRGNVERKEFTDEELEKIGEIMRERYSSDEWTYGREPAFTYTNKKRFPGGQLEIFLDVKGGVIKNAVIRGDFLALRPVSIIEEKLIGARHTEAAMLEALRSVDVQSVLGSLTEKELAETLV